MSMKIRPSGHFQFHRLFFSLRKLYANNIENQNISGLVLSYKRRRHEEAKKAYAALMSCYPFELEDLEGEQWRDINGFTGTKSRTSGASNRSSGQSRAFSSLTSEEFI